MRILFVDDDQQVLEGLRRMLFGRRGVWDMRFVSDPRAALESLHQEPAELVVSDLQMPQMDGAALLEQVSARFPETIRYALTGVLDHPLLGRAMRCAHHVIAKPCRPCEMREVLTRAETITARMQALKQSSLLSGLDGLPVMPEVHCTMLDLIDSPKSSLRAVGQLVAQDVGLSARVIQLANSVYFGRPGRIHDPSHAVVFLGDRTVKAMVLTDGLFACLDPALVAAFGISGLQSHCIRVGMLARKICTTLQFSKARTEAASTAGILHDAGKIVWVLQQQEMFARSLGHSRRTGVPLFEAERQLWGLSHAELVGAMLQLWAMPAEMIEAAAFHHRPEEATGVLSQRPVPTLADVICLADAIDHQLCSSGMDGATPGMDMERLRYLGLVETANQWRHQHMDLHHKETDNDSQSE